LTIQARKVWQRRFSQGQVKLSKMPCHWVDLYLRGSLIKNSWSNKSSKL
jgi:hypothetical protein